MIIKINNNTNFVFFSLQLQIVVLVKNAGRVISVLLSIFLISIAVLILTPLGFPYSGDPNSPAAQRFMIVVIFLFLDLMLILNVCKYRESFAKI